MDDKRTDYEPNFIMSDSPNTGESEWTYSRPAAGESERTYSRPAAGESERTYSRPTAGESEQTYSRPASGKPVYSSTSSGAPVYHSSASDTTSYNRPVSEGSTYSRSETEGPAYSRPDAEGSTYSRPAAGEPTYYNPDYDPGSQNYSATWTSSGRSSNRGFETGRSAREKRRAEKKPSPPVTLTRKTLAFLVAGCLVFSSLFGLGASYIGSSIWNGGDASAPTASTTSSSNKTTGYNLENATGSNMTVQEITDNTQKSVVEIKTESASADSWLQNYVTEGAGSGVIISDDGYIMTNNHVIDGANKITVTTADSKSYDATLVGTDSTNDVAVIKIKAKGLTPVTYGNSDQLQVGDLAVAIGNPLGELGGTVTAGIISATDRQLNIDGTTMTLLQTDSSINPGNSGGGLFNGDGQLVGLVVAKSSGSDVEGLGFAIPVNTAADVAQQLMDNGYVSNQPCTGMTYTEGSSGFDSFFGETSGGTVYIYSVDSNTAKLAGFKAGDIVYAIDGTEISSIDDVSGVVTSHKVGDKVTFTVLRDGQAKDITLKLQEKTKEQQEEQNAQSSQNQ